MIRVADVQWDPVAEMSVLGSVCLDASVLPEVLSVLGRQDFYSTANQLTFDALLSLSEQKTPIDSITLYDELSRHDALVRVGGAEFITKILEAVPHAENAAYYAKIVHEKAMERAALAVVEEAGGRLRRPGIDGAEVVIAETCDRLGALKATASGVRPRPAAIVTPFADILPLPVVWLWEGRIPAAMPSLIIGDGGKGKSTVLRDLAARLSRGDRMPDGAVSGEPRVVLWITAEDDPARVLRPGLDAAGADVDRVQLLTMRGNDGEERELVLDCADLGSLETAIVEHHAALVILDPIAANIPAKVDAHRDEDLRRVLSPLAKIAGRTGVAIVGVKHIGKDSSRDALQRILGSAAWGNAARSVLAVGLDPHDEGGERRILAHVKCNPAALAPSLAFRLVMRQGEPVPHVEWLGLCDVDAGDLLGPTMDAEERSALAVAIDVLREMLPTGVEVPTKTVEAEARRRDVSARTLARARKALGVKKRQPGGPGHPWVMWLAAPGTLADGTLGGNGTGCPLVVDPAQNAKPDAGTLGGNGRMEAAQDAPCQSANDDSAKGARGRNGTEES